MTATSKTFITFDKYFCRPGAWTDGPGGGVLGIAEAIYIRKTWRGSRLVGDPELIDTRERRGWAVVAYKHSGQAVWEQWIYDVVPADPPTRDDWNLYATEEDALAVIEPDEDL